MKNSMDHKSTGLIVGVLAMVAVMCVSAWVAGYTMAMEKCNQEKLAQKPAQWMGR